MKKHFKTIVIVFIIPVLVGIGFVAGWFVARNRVVTYRNNNCGIAYHRDWPTYGIPIAEYLFIKQRLDNDNVARAHSNLNGLIDQAVCDAKNRWAVAPKEDKKKIQRPLWALAQYRKTNPRTLLKISDDLTYLRNNQEKILAKQKTVDKFLATIDAMGPPRGMQNFDDSKKTHNNSNHRD